METGPRGLNQSDIGDSRIGETSPRIEPIIIIDVPSDVAAGIGVPVENWLVGADVTPPDSRGEISAVMEQTPPESPPIKYVFGAETDAERVEREAREDAETNVTLKSFFRRSRASSPTDPEESADKFIARVSRIPQKHSKITRLTSRLRRRR